MRPRHLPVNTSGRGLLYCLNTGHGVGGGVIITQQIEEKVGQNYPTVSERSCVTHAQQLGDTVGQKTHHLSDLQKLILLALTDGPNSVTRLCIKMFPDRSEITHHVYVDGTNWASTSRALKTLERKGLVHTLKYDQRNDYGYGLGDIPRYAEKTSAVVYELTTIGKESLRKLFIEYQNESIRLKPFTSLITASPVLKEEEEYIMFQRRAPYGVWDKFDELNLSREIRLKLFRLANYNALQYWIWEVTGRNKELHEKFGAMHTEVIRTELKAYLDIKEQFEQILTEAPK